MVSDRAYLRGVALQVLTKNLNVFFADSSLAEAPQEVRNQIDVEMERVALIAARFGDMVHDAPIYSSVDEDPSDKG